MADPIPAAALSAGTLEYESLPAGTPAAEAVRRILEAAVPLVRESDRVGTATEWGVRYRIVVKHEYAQETEHDARADVAAMRSENPGWDPVLLKRTAARPAGPWEEVQDA